ncbi:MAG: hypothetical protein SGCHY_000112 [Lobulomycetales sp.]
MMEIELQSAIIMETYSYGAGGTLNVYIVSMLDRMYKLKVFQDRSQFNPEGLKWLTTDYFCGIFSDSTIATIKPEELISSSSADKFVTPTAVEERVYLGQETEDSPVADVSFSNGDVVTLNKKHAAYRLDSEKNTVKPIGFLPAESKVGAGWGNLNPDGSLSYAVVDDSLVLWEVSSGKISSRIKLSDDFRIDPMDSDAYLYIKGMIESQWTKLNPTMPIRPSELSIQELRSDREILYHREVELKGLATMFDQERRKLTGDLHSSIHQHNVDTSKLKKLEQEDKEKETKIVKMSEEKNALQDEIENAKQKNREMEATIALQQEQLGKCRCEIL